MRIQLISILLLLLIGTPFSQAEEKKAAPPPGTEAEPAKLYFQIEPPLVVNVNEDDVVRFLQIHTQIQYSDQLALAIIEKHMPAIRDSMIMALSGQPVKDIKTPQGKEKLRESTLHALQKVMTDITGKPVVDAVYFTGFVIQ